MFEGAVMYGFSKTMVSEQSHGYSDGNTIQILVT